MSLRDKLQSQPQAPTIQFPGSPQQNATRPDIMVPAPRATISQGRKRKAYTRAHFTLDAARAVSLWAAERLIADPGNAVFVGFNGSLNTRNRSGSRTRITPYYETITLVQDFQDWCKAKNWPVPPTRYLSGLILKWAVEQGIPASADRSYRQRRKIIRGVRIANTAPWSGNEND